MLIFKKQTQPEEPQPHWLVQLKQSLIKNCHQFIETHSSQPKLIHKPKLWYNFCANSQFTETANYSLESKGQGAYSEYVPIKSNQYQSNQLTEYFHYLKHQAERNRADYEVCVFNISEAIESGKDYKQWMETCREYLSDLTIEEMFSYYHILLAKGPHYLNELRKKRSPKCRASAFFYKVLEVKRFMANGCNKLNPHFSISLDRGDKITLENLSKTMKNLFCSICMVYDCQRHLVPTSAIENNFQYIREFDIRHRLENRKRSSLRLFQQLLVIFKLQETKETQFCSEECFRRLEVGKWEELQRGRKTRMFSPIFEEIVKMGIELFDYDPCRIKTLLSNITAGKGRGSSEAQCSLVFSYFLQEFNLPQKMMFKFYESQVEQLVNQSQIPTYFAVQNSTKKQLKLKAKTKKCANHDQSYNSVCFHYFLNKEPNDVTCLTCDCQMRGYCLPSCGCSELCQIRLKGCRCRGDSSCWENKCPCFKNNLVCLPQICENCFKCDQLEGRLNWCQNSEKSMHRGKRTRIGQSNIPNAGMGLFACEFMLKGEFVIKYLGEILDSISLQKFRESLLSDNLFYSFKLNKYESIDSRIYGNKARFINHSKKGANIVPRTININQELLIVFHAARDIHPGEELLFNYNGEGELSDFKDKYPFID